MSYFPYFPNVYVGEGVTDDESIKYRLVKNIFEEVRARDDLNEYATLFEAYEVKDGDTPSSLAFELFDDQFLDWVVVLINDMVDIYSEWLKESHRFRSIYQRGL